MSESLDILLDLRAKAMKVDPFLGKPEDTDPPGSEEEVQYVERFIGALLPRTYRRLLLEFGAGQVGFVNLFSVRRGSEWFLPTLFEECKEYLPEGLIPFSDDHCGGYHVLVVKDGKASEEVHYWNTDGGLVSTRFRNVAEYLVRYAYQPA